MLVLIIIIHDSNHFLSADYILRTNLYVKYITYGYFNDLRLVSGFVFEMPYAFADNIEYIIKGHFCLQCHSPYLRATI